MPRAANGVELAGRLDALYHDYNRIDSASDPIQKVRPFADPADREVAGFCAAALAFGRVASVLNSIQTLFDTLGPNPAAFVRRFNPEAPPAAMRTMVHRWIRGTDLIALFWMLRQMLEQSGSIEGFFAEGLKNERRGHRPGARQLLEARARAGYAQRLQTPAKTSGRVLLLSPAVRRQRLQAAQSISALDGAPRRSRPWRVEERARVETDCPSGHARHPSGPMPSIDAIYEPRVAHGGGHHRVAARVESRRIR